MKSTNPFLLSLLFICFFSNDTKSSQELPEHCNIKKINWIEGSWISKNSQTTTTENWKTIDSKNISGSGTVLKTKKGSIPFTENLHITEMSGDIFYLAKTPENIFPIAFKLTECTKKTIRFTNSEHDFPNQIIYKKTSSNQMVAEVKGSNNNGFQIKYTRSIPVINNDNNTDLVKEYVEAYNQMNLSKMKLLMAPDIHWLSVNGSSVKIESESKKALVNILENHFKQANQSTSSLHNLDSTANFVTAIEKSRSIQNGNHQVKCSLSIYQLKDKLIKNVWYYPAEEC